MCYLADEVEIEIGEQQLLLRVAHENIQRHLCYAAMLASRHSIMMESSSTCADDSSVSIKAPMAAEHLNCC